MPFVRSVQNGRHSMNRSLFPTHFCQRFFSCWGLNWVPTSQNHTVKSWPLIWWYSEMRLWKTIMFRWSQDDEAPMMEYYPYITRELDLSTTQGHRGRWEATFKSRRQPSAEPQQTGTLVWLSALRTMKNKCLLLVPASLHISLRWLKQT